MSDSPFCPVKCPQKLWREPYSFAGNALGNPYRASRNTKNYFWLRGGDLSGTDVAGSLCGKQSNPRSKGRGREVALHMSKNLIRVGFGLTLTVVALAWAGCSSTDRLVSGPGSAQSSQITNYFPLDEGTTAIFSVTSSGVTEQKSFTMSGNVQIGNAHAVRWVISTNGSPDTSYFVATDSALYYLETANAEAEKILSLPFEIGASWPRYYNYDVTGYSNGNLGTGTDIGTGGINPFGYKDTSATNGGYGAKNYPSEGGNTFTVVGTETISLGSLGTFAGTLKIKNVGYGGSTNFYWYAPEVGLVKYQLETNADGSATPQTEGLLVATN